MIQTYAYDVEILPNFFSITFVDLKSYLEIFKDACTIEIKKGKEKRTPIPLTQKYSVKEIKEKLDKVKTYGFYITDKDDTQLLKFLSFINEMRPHLNEKGEKVVTHCYGYNSESYDKLMCACFLMNALVSHSTKDLIKTLYETSKKIISLQDNPEMSRSDYALDNMRKYALPYKDIDVMKIFALNKVGKGEDANGNTIYFGKSLKQTSINLQWYELLDYELPPISEKDFNLYADMDKYFGLSIEELNQVVDKWDRFMIPEYIEPTMHYNKNDVLIVCEMIRLFPDEIKLRYQLSYAYEIDFSNSSRSNIADKLFIKFYSEFSNLQPKQWRGKKTERHALSFNKIIFDNIYFKTKPLQDLLEKMKKVVIYSIGKTAFMETITINNCTYTIATGGLHSKDIPRELKSKIKDSEILSTGEIDWEHLSDDSYIYVHYDISDVVSYKNLLNCWKLVKVIVLQHKMKI